MLESGMVLQREALRSDLGWVLVVYSWTCLLMRDKSPVPKCTEEGKLDGIFGAFAGGFPDEQAKGVIRRWSHLRGRGAIGIKPDCRAFARAAGGDLGRDNPPVREIYARISFTTRPCTSVSR